MEETKDEIWQSTKMTGKRTKQKKKENEEENLYSTV